MIQITRFPKQQYNLWDIISPCLNLNLTFDINVVWQYTSDSELNVTIDADTIEGSICAWLSSCGFQFESVAQTDVKKYSSCYQLSPGSGQEGSFEKNQSQSSLFVLLTGLLKTDGGELNINLINNSSVFAKITIQTNSTQPPNEIKSAFGDIFELTSGGSISGSFPFSYNIHGQVLSLPFTGDSADALVTGFGEPRQAISLPKNDNDVVVGEIFNDVLHRKLTLTSENLKNSTAIFGSPGYGKSTLVNSLLFQEYQNGVNFVVIEPAKEEYRMLRGLIPQLIVLSDMQVYNPLVPPVGMEPSMYAEVVLELIDLATETPRDSPLRDYFRETYLRCISNDQLNVKPGNVLSTYKQIMDEQGFTSRAKDFVANGEHRLKTFFMFFCGQDYAKKQLDFLKIAWYLEQKIPVVIELNTIPTPRMKTAFMYWILSHLKAYFQQKKSSEIKHILVLEEAHNILGETLHPALITDVTNIVAENRAKGQTTFIIEQSPSRIDQGATNLCGNIFSFRLTAEKDRKYAASMLDVDKQELNMLRKHCCLARTNSMYSSEHIHVEVDEKLLQSLHLVSSKQ